MAIHYILEVTDLATALVAQGKDPAQPKDRVYRLMDDGSIKEEIVKQDGTLRLVHHTSKAAFDLLGKLATDAGGNLTLDGVIVGEAADLSAYALAADIPPPVDITPLATKTELQAVQSAIPAPPDLTPYATTTALADVVATIPPPVDTTILYQLGTDAEGKLTFNGVTLGEGVVTDPVTIDVTTPLALTSIEAGDAVSTALSGAAQASDDSEVTRVGMYFLDGVRVDFGDVGLAGQDLAAFAYFTNGLFATVPVSLGPVTILAVAGSVPTISFAEEPSTNGLSTVTERRVVQDILDGFFEGSAEVSTGGVASIEAVLIVNGAAADPAYALATGDLIDAVRYVATATDAQPVEVTLPIGIIVQAFKPTIRRVSNTQTFLDPVTEGAVVGDAVFGVATYEAYDIDGAPITVSVATQLKLGGSTYTNGILWTTQTATLADQKVRLRVTITAPGADTITLFLDAPVEAAEVANNPTTATIAHNGATFTVTNVTDQGVFADGAPWVVTAAGAQITRVAPASQLVASRTINGGGTVANTMVHGLMKNPGNAALYNAGDMSTLAARQAVNWQHSGGSTGSGKQGYDGAVLKTIFPAYDPAMNIDPGATGQPISATVGTYVKAISPLGSINDRPTLESFAVLHVLPSVPAADALAPPVQPADKTIRVRKSEIDPSIFFNFTAPANLPDAAEVIRLLDWVHTWQKTYGTNTENIVPVPRPRDSGLDGFAVASYMGTTHELFASSALILETDRWTQAEKLEIATRLVGHAVDMIGRIHEGGVIQDNGGWSGGGALTLWAATITGNQWITDATSMTAVVDIGNAGKLTKIGESVWGEWKQHRYITQDDIDADHSFVKTVGGVNYTDTYDYTQKMLGWPDWNGDATRNRVMHNSLGAPIKHPESYRQINAKSDAPFALALRLRGIRRGTLPAADPTLDYIDRHMGWLLGTDAYAGIDLSQVTVNSPDARNPRTNNPNPITQFTRDLWAAHRGTGGLWTVDGYGPEPTPEVPAGTGTMRAAYITQSEPLIAFAIIGSAYTSGPYPSIVSGVDAKIAIQATSNTTSAEAVRSVTAAEITAKTINPGFVALANLWHVGSGGRPLRITSAQVQGTSMSDMLDAQNTGRDTAADLSIVSYAAAQFGGPVTRVVRSWWNAEASNSQSLRETRSPHLIGRNQDGTDYDFDAQPGIDYAVIDTTGRGKGMFPNTAKLDLMLPGFNLPQGGLTHALIDPPLRNYTTRSDGTSTNLTKLQQNGAPAIAEHKAFMPTIPATNRGLATLTSSLCLAGDYSGGIQAAQPSQGITHPAVKDADGQQLHAQHHAASLLMAEGHLKPSRVLRLEVAGDGAWAELVIEMANGGTLSTMRKAGRGSAIGTPRPHQQPDGMGLEVQRSGASLSNRRPLYRADQTDATLYPATHRGSVQITNTGTVVNGVREARVRITPSQPFVVGDAIHFGYDGGYGAFILHGHPDHDARLYLDALVEHIPALLPANYHGLPIEPQVSITINALGTATDTTPPPDPDPGTPQGVSMFDFSAPNVKDSTGFTWDAAQTALVGTTNTNAVARYIAFETIAPRPEHRSYVYGYAEVTVSYETVITFVIASNIFLSNGIATYSQTLTPTTPGTPQTFTVEGELVNPLSDDYGGIRVRAVTTAGPIKIAFPDIIGFDAV